MAAQAIHHELSVTQEEYLERERKAEFKSEYVDGRIYAMSGGSLPHSVITVNLTAEVRTQLKGKPCQALSNDTKIRAANGGLYAYPDLSVVCGEPAVYDARGHVVTNPTVLFEVLSPSTEAFDRDLKFRRYRTNESLTDYVLIAQDEPRVEHFARQNSRQWLLSVITGLDGVLRLASIGCTLALSELYDRVVFPTPDADAAPPPA